MSKGPELLVVIPAFKEQSVFQDDLVKKLAGHSLVERAINKALSLDATIREIILFTDSEDISLIGKRNRVSSVFLTSGMQNLAHALRSRLNESSNIRKKAISVLMLSPYAPLITKDELMSALSKFISSNVDVLRPVRHEKHQLFRETPQAIDEFLSESQDHELILNSQAFSFFHYDFVVREVSHPAKMAPWVLSQDMVEIETLQDWWVLEKLLQRKRIVFRVIGNNEVGMGHIYRALSIAHELTDHEILFVCDSESYEVVDQLAGYDYWLDVVPAGEMIDLISKLNPDLVINDMLDTTAAYVKALKTTGSAVVNFEDLGSGAALSDLTINELYDEPTIEGPQILWGHNYFFVREEFDQARQHKFSGKVHNILLTFGGTDQHNLTRAIYRAVWELCGNFGVHIHIVTGPGYQGYKALAKEVRKNGGASLTHATGVMSQIMEQTEIAITSNGRTVYELAHMKIPSIVIPQNERECTHSFANEGTGFIAVSPYQKGVSEDQVYRSLKKLLTQSNYRLNLMKNMEPYSFRENKQKVLSEILQLVKAV
jgi:spore coat polysaccharide biosynthesis predicted glycosyltransferase SpsG/CMP-N-acetylneuraminic acid synthetase